VSRNAIIAFALILLASWFFFSPWYYKYILRQPYPYHNQTTKEAVKSDSTVSKSKSASPSEVPEIKKDTAIAAPAALNTQKRKVAAPEALPQTAIADSAQPANSYDTITIETDKIICKISEMGARIISLKTKEYGYNRTKRGIIDNVDSLIELVPDTGRLGGANLTIAAQSYDSAYFEAEVAEKHLNLAASQKKEIAFTLKQAAGLTLTKRFVFSNGSYRIQMRVESPALAGKSITVGWLCGVRESEEPTGSSSDQYNRMKAHLFSNAVEHIDMKKPANEENSGQYRWIGITSKYFLVALIPQGIRDADVTIAGFEDPRFKGGKTVKINYGISLKRVCDEAVEEYDIYAGPAQIQELRQQKQKLEKVLYGGWAWLLRGDIWFPIICEYFLLILIYIQKAVKDWGIAILLITIIIKAITYPLTLSSMRSMSRMKDLQPKLTALRQKYKANPKKMNEEMMALYKAEGVNPLDPGCLPMFLQMPLLIALFIVLQRAIELRGAPTIIVPWVKDLSMPEAIFYFPFTIPWYGNNFALIPIVMAVLTFFQNKMTIKDPNQKFMIWFMPLFMFVLFNAFPSGLVIYWTFSSALGLIQQKIVDRSKARSLPVVPVPVPTKHSPKNKRR
jgi:YidC/Oxa1 family membrane protein insertase